MKFVLDLLGKLLPKNIVKFFDGKKTIIGLIGLIVCTVLKLLNVELPNQLFEVFTIIFGGGFTHKLVKLNAETKELQADIIRSINGISKVLEEYIRDTSK